MVAREAIKQQNRSEIITSVGIVGAAGKVGEFLTGTLNKVPDVRIYPTVRGGIGRMFEGEPDVVILATANPVREVLEEIAQHIKKPFILVLPQNGVDVVPIAQRVLENSTHQISLIRASLFTPVSHNEAGDLVYDQKKKRIALAPVRVEAVADLTKTQSLFARAGFDVKLVGDYQPMEWTKLWANGWGTTSSATLLSLWETFSNRKLFEIEHQGVKDRLEILKAAGIELADIKWVQPLRLLASLPGFISWITPLRWYVADKTIWERNNQPLAAAQQIEKGDKEVESADFYHKPMIDLGKQHALHSPVDETIYEILIRHRRKGLDLAHMEPSERRKLFLEIADLKSRPVFIKTFAPVRLAAEAYYKHYASSLEISGAENLDEVAECLKSGKSVLFALNHRAHPDHMTIVEALRTVLPGIVEKYPVIFVAGMLFDKEFLSRLLSRTYSHTVLWTIKDAMSEEERWRSRIINRRTGEITEELLKQPTIFVLYPEGTRSRNGQLQKAASGASLLLSHPKIELVVPAAITGTEIMLPPGEGKKGFQMPHHADLTIEFGKVIKTLQLREEASLFAHRQREKYISGVVMKEIAEMLPKDQRGVW